MSKCNDCHKNIEKTVVEKALHGYATYIDICNECIDKYPINDRGLRLYSKKGSIGVETEEGIRVINDNQQEVRYRDVRASDLYSQTVRWDTDKYKIKYFDAEKGVIEFVEAIGSESLGRNIKITTGTLKAANVTGDKDAK